MSDLASLFVKYLNFDLLLDHISEFIAVPCSSYYMVVDPVIVPPSRFAHQQGVVSETLLQEPLFCDFSVVFRPGGKKANSVSLVVP